jgi:hypothetical protein
MPNGIYPVPEIDVKRVPTDPARHVQRFSIRTLWKRRRPEDLAREVDAAKEAASDLRAARLRNPRARY